jgi:hypothetical protein
MKALPARCMDEESLSAGPEVGRCRRFEGAADQDRIWSAAPAQEGEILRSPCLVLTGRRKRMALRSLRDVRVMRPLRVARGPATRGRTRAEPPP